MSEESMLMALGFVYYASGAPRWVGACLLLPTTRDTITARPAYYNTMHRRTTIVTRGITETGALPEIVLFFYKKLIYSKSYKDKSKIPVPLSPGRLSASK